MKYFSSVLLVVSIKSKFLLRMSAPIILYCPYVPSDINEMDIADELWHSNIAWVSMVALSETEDPVFNSAYIEISGWLSDWRSGQSNYERFGTIDTQFGVFSEVSKLYNNIRIIKETFKDRMMEFPLQYYITPLTSEPERMPIEAQQTEEAGEGEESDDSSVEDYSWDKPNFTGMIIPEVSPLMKSLFQVREQVREEQEPKKERYISPLVLEHIAEQYLDSEWKTVGLAGEYGYNVYDEF